MTRQRWINLIQRFEQSSLTQAEFAQRNQLNLHTFRSWLYRLRRERPSQPPEFLPVELIAHQPAQRHALEIDLGGCVLRFTKLPRPAFLFELLSGLIRETRC